MLHQSLIFNQNNKIFYQSLRIEPNISILLKDWSKAWYLSNIHSFSLDWSKKNTSWLYRMQTDFAS